jgi:transcriptional regulator with XRE-family HTH domain
VFEIGTSLRRARQRLGLELPQVEEATRIRAKYLRALEEDRFELLPGAAYAKGFLRVYADFLGLEGERFVDEFNARFPPADTVETPQLVRVRPKRHLLSSRLVVIPVALSLALFAWRMTTGGGGHHHAANAPPAPRVRLSKVVPNVQATAPSPPTTAALSLVATRGTCWVSVRKGSQGGKVLYERTLQLGDRVRLEGTRLWARLGAPWNLDATLNGKHVALPATIADVLVTSRALQALTR